MQQELLLKNFPGLRTVHLDGYKVLYGKRSFAIAVLRQLPRLLGVVRQEHAWLRRLAATGKIDGILSDNRYGLYHPAVPSVIITHQPGLKTGFGGLADKLLRVVHFSFLKKFHEIWIPDNEGICNLGGALSHPATLPYNAKYTGLLSQMAPPDRPKEGHHLLVLLSGPEPQRTMLERLLWQQVIGHKCKVIFVGGKAGASPPGKIPVHVTWYAQLDAAALQPIMEAATYIICRGGYSTLMDLALLQKKAILIPTPGQAEQEYLGAHLQEQEIFLAYRQRQFSLEKALTDAEQFAFKPLALSDVNARIQAVLDDWVGTL